MFVPASPTWHEVQQALALTNGGQPVDIPDHALLLLLAVYGLRAGEVVRLRLNDLDWEQELLTVIRSKSGRSQIYPLSRVVGAALIRYLREARPPRLGTNVPRRPASKEARMMVTMRATRPE